MENSNLFEAVRTCFPPNLDETAIDVIDPSQGASQRFSWRDIEDTTAKIASFLNELGISNDARVAVHCDKSVEALLLYLAVIRGGWIYLPLNNSYVSAEVEYFVRDSAPEVIVCADRNIEWMRDLANAAGVRHVYSLNENRTGTLIDAISTQSVQFNSAPKLASEIAAILYTSGTTGRSKGAQLTHGNLVSNARTLTEYWGWNNKSAPQDVLIHALPLFHVHGLFVASHCALMSGSRMLWLNRFEPSKAIELFARGTVFMGVPTMYVRLLGQPGLTRDACAHMRLFVSGSAPLLLSTFNEFSERTGHTILERYGMSETLMLTSNPLLKEEGERIGGTVGRPLPGMNLRIRCSTSDVLLSRSEIGNIEVSGPSVFSGYWRMPEKNLTEFTADGWFKTGDVGFQNSHGVVTLIGRSKDLIISGGYNVYPAEVEAILDTHPAVAESAVIGVPHPDFGEGVVAVVVPRDPSLDESDITTYMRGKVAGYKTPKKLFAVESLPRNAMGKVQKAVLRERFQNSFKTEE